VQRSHIAGVAWPRALKNLWKSRTRFNGHQQLPPRPGRHPTALPRYALLLRMEPSSAYLEMLPAQIIARFGVGAAVPLTTSMLLSATSRAQSGIASAGLNAVRQTGAAIGVAMFGAFMNTDAVHGFKIAIGLAAGLLLAVTVGAAVLLRKELAAR
jgi:MFS transporter, DHA2 family, methylenomycin A resistance protein